MSMPVQTIPRETTQPRRQVLEVEKKEELPRQEPLWRERIQQEYGE